MYRATFIQMSKSIRESVEDILEEQEQRQSELAESVEELLDEIEEQELTITHQDEYINLLLSPQRYVELLVAVLLSYMYGAWFGLYMCPK